MSVDPKIIARIGMRDRARILAYIRVIVRDGDLAEDVLQEVHALAIEKAAEIESEQVVGRWLRGAARRIALRMLRDRDRGPSTLDSAALDALDVQWSGMDEAGDHTRDAVRALEQCLTQLADNARKILDLRYKAQLTGVQIAKRLGRTPESLYVTMSRIHARLGKCVRGRLRGDTR